MNKVSLIIFVLLAIGLFCVPKKHRIFMFLVGIMFVPFDQRLILAGIDFTFLRLLVLVGCLRAYLRNEAREVRWHVFDMMVFAWVILGSIVYVFRIFTFDAIINRLGGLFDAFLLYYIFRSYFSSWKAVQYLIYVCGGFAVIAAILALVEYFMHWNPFELLGNVTTGFHRGRYRCGGSFGHAILLGILWATLFPLFVGCAMGKRTYLWLWGLASISCFVIVFCTGSSTPWMTILFASIGLCLFPFRKYGKITFWACAGLVAMLHLVMNKPVWHLIGRIRFIGGSTGYHRFNLIDQAISHFWDWAFIGTNDTASWGWGLQDVTNQYIRQGVNGGIVALLAFVYLIVVSVITFYKFALVKEHTRTEQWLGWAFCISILGHCIAFMGVSYFDKMPAVLYLNFAIVGMIIQSNKQPCRRKHGGKRFIGDDRKQVKAGSGKPGEQSINHSLENEYLSGEGLFNVT